MFGAKIRKASGVGQEAIVRCPRWASRGVMGLVLALVVVAFVTAGGAGAVPTAHTFTLHLGQSSVLTRASPGDRVICRGAGTSVQTRVRRAATAYWVWNRKLQLNVSVSLHGVVSASCRLR